MTTFTTNPPIKTNCGFRGLPVSRLEELRDRYLHLYASDPATAPYSAAALAELDAAIAAARAKGAA